MPDQLIFEKICAVQSEIGCIGKGEKNIKQGYNFRGIDTVYNELHDIFVKHNVFSTTEVLEDKHEERKTKSGSVLIYRILKIKYTFYAEDGSCVSSTVIGEGMDTGDKASNKAMAVGHKYALLQLLTIPTLEQKDPDYETHEVIPVEEELITFDQVTVIQDEIARRQGIDVQKLLAWATKEFGYKVKEIADLRPKNVKDIMTAVQKKPLKV